MVLVVIKHVIGFNEVIDLSTVPL